jgi:virulence-associated protein VapD
VFIAASEVMPEEMQVENDEASFKDFLKGFLEGIGIKENIEEILKCAKEEGEAIVKKIQEAINHFKHINIIHIQEIIKGLKCLVEAVHMIVDMLKDCAKNVKEIIKLINAIKNINWVSLAHHVIKNAPQLIKDIAQLASAIAKKDMYGAGKAFGDIVKRVLVGATELENPVSDFFQAFFKGIKAEEEYQKILGCVYDMEKLVLEVIEAIKLIMTLDPFKIIQGALKLKKVVEDIIAMLQPCIDKAQRLKKLVEAIKNVNWINLGIKIISNIKPLIDNIKMIVAGIKAQNFYNIGLGLGNILEFAFLE